MQRIVLSSTSPIKAYTTRNNAQERYKKISASSGGDSSPFSPIPIKAFQSLK